MSKIEYSEEDFYFIFQFGQFNANYPSTVIKNNFILDYDCQLRTAENINDLRDNLKKMSSFIYKFFEDSIDDYLRDKLGRIDIDD